MKNIQLVKQAIKAIEDVFGNTSVPKQQTLDDLEEILSSVEGKCELLRGEIERES